MLDPVIAHLTDGRAYRHVIGFEANELRRAHKDAGYNTATRTGEYPLLHVTEWDLRRAPHFTRAPGTRVLVCENPRMIEGLTERGVDGWAAVCTSGEPNLVVDKVLRHLARSSIELRYHGDFDWPGVAIANWAIERYGVVPWWMTVDDYTRAARSDGLRLGDRPVEPVWDSELGAAMRIRDRAVHEESVLSELLDALADGQ